MNGAASGRDGRVSVIIPTFNRAALLPRAITSVFNQTAADLCDIVVVDDGSTDSTSEVAAGFAARIHYIRQPHAGAAAARNTAIRASRGEFVAFLDTDDEWEPDKTERQLEVMRRWPDVVLVSGRALARYADGRTRPHLTPAIPFNRPTDFARPLFNGNFMPTPTIMVRRHYLEQTDLFHPDLLRRHDYHLWVRLACLGPCVYLDRLVATYDDDTPQGLSRDKESCLRFSLRARRLLKGELGARPDCCGPWRREMANCLASLRDHAYRSGRFADAARFGLESLMHRPWPRPKWEWRRVLSALWRAAVAKHTPILPGRN